MAHKRGGAESCPLTLPEELRWAESRFRTGLRAEKRCTLPPREEILGGALWGSSALQRELLQESVQQQSPDKDAVTDSS